MRHAAAGAMLMLLTACGGQRPSQSPSAPLPAARMSDADVARWARLLQAVDQRRVDSAAIADALDRGAPGVRAAGALSVGQLGAKALAPRLYPLLAERDTAVAASAAFALGLLRDTAAVPQLQRALAGPPSLAAEAAWALGEVGEPARAAIEGGLRGDGVAPEVAGALLLAAARLRPVPVDAVVPFLTHDHPELPWRAGYAIARPYAAAGARPLLRHALSPDDRLRAQVARGLSRPATGDSLAADAMRALQVLLVHPAAHVRVAAVRALASHGEPARTAVLSGMRDPDPGVRITAASSLASVMDRDLRRWSWIWDADTSLAYRSAVLASAEQIGVVIPDVLHWRAHDDWRFRFAVVTAVSGARDRARAMNAILPFTRDADPRVRRAAASGLARLDSARLHRSRLREMLGDGDPEVRLAVAEALGERVDAPPESGRAERPLAWYEEVVRELALAALEERRPLIELHTSRGIIVLELLPADAPLTVHNFLTLARRGYYDGTRFHRVIAGFVAQGGDPRGDGTGGPGWTLRDEPNRYRFGHGMTGMAHSGPHTAGSQFFITHTAQPHLDGAYTPFGYVRSGMDVLERLVQGDALTRVVVR